MTRLLFASVKASLRYPSGKVEAFDALYIPHHDAAPDASVSTAGLAPVTSPAVVPSRGRA